MSQTGGIGFSRNYNKGAIPVWQHDKSLQLVQGGFALATTNLVNGQVIPAGTPLAYDESARTATVLNAAKVNTAALATDTAIKVNKGHNFVVGQNAAVSVGGAAYAISSIDQSNSAYDVLNLATALGVALNPNDTLFGSSANGATAAALPAGLNGLLYEETLVNTSQVASVSAVIKGTVYARRIPYNSAIAALEAFDGIVFSQSK